MKSPRSRFDSNTAATRRSVLAGFVATLALISGVYAIDQDADGWDDSVDNDPLSRAVVQWGLADRISGDTYSGPGPAWFDGAVKTGGTWTTEGWVSTDATGNPALLIHVDRTLLAQDLAFVLASTDVGGDMRVDLLDAQGVVVASDVLGNALDLTGPVNLPLAGNPTAATVRLRHVAGSVTVHATHLYVDQDLDGLDISQEAQLGTSDTAADTDGDGFRDRYESIVGHSPVDAQDFPASALTLQVPANATVEYDGSTAPDATGYAQAWQNDGQPVSVTWSDASPSAWDANLIAHWKLDELATATSASADGFGSASAASGAQSGAVGRYGRAWSFDGMDDHLWIGQNATLSNLTDNFTVGAWVKPSRLSGSQRVLSSLAGNGWGFGLNGSKLRFTCYGLKDYESTGTLSAGTWQHIAVSFSGGTATFYINGAPAGSVSGGAPANVATTGWRIARGLYDCYAGSIDDLAVWKRPLDAAEIAGVHARGPVGYALESGARPLSVWNRVWTATGSAGTATASQRIVLQDTMAPSLTCPPAATVAFGASTAPAATGTATAWDQRDATPLVYSSDSDYRTGLQVLLPMDEPDAYCRDSSGNNRVFQGTATSTAGRIGTAMKFDGTGKLQSATNAIPGSAQLSVSLWFKTTQATRSMLYSLEGAAFAYIENGRIMTVFDGSSTNDPWWGQGLNDGQWHHYCAWNIGTTTVLCIDGQQVGSRSETLTNLNTLSRTSALGAQYDGQSYRFNGSLDEFAVWTRLLHSTEVSALAAGSSQLPLVRTWTAADFSGNTSTSAQLITRTGMADDNDEDGIPNRDEELAGTDANNDDTDGDGYNDAEEMQYGGDPTDGEIPAGVTAAIEGAPAVSAKITAGVSSFYYGTKTSGTDILLNGDSTGTQALDKAVDGSGFQSSTKSYVTLWRPAPGVIELIFDGYFAGNTQGEPVTITGSMTLANGNFTGEPVVQSEDNATGSVTRVSATELSWDITCNPYPNLPTTAENRGWKRVRINYSPAVQLVGLKRVFEKHVGPEEAGARCSIYRGIFSPTTLPEPAVTIVYETPSEGVEYTASPASGTSAVEHAVTIPDSSQEGTIPCLVSWTPEGGVTQTVKANIRVSDCSVCGADAIGTSVSSVDVGIPLGVGLNGTKGGVVQLKTEDLESLADLSTVLKLDTQAEGVRPLHEAGVLRQVEAPTRIVKVEPISPTELRLDLFSRVGTETRDTSGRFTCDDANRIMRCTLTRTGNRLDIVEDLGLAQRLYAYTQDSANGIWSLSRGTGLSLETLSHPAATVGTKASLREIANASGTVVSRRLVETVPAPVGFKGTRVARVVDGDRVFLRTFTATGRTAMETHSDGSWTRYIYDEQDRLISVVTPVGNAALYSPANACRIVTYDYSPLYQYGDLAEVIDAGTPRTRTEYVLGQVVGRTWYIFSRDADGGRLEIEEQAASASSPYGATGNVRRTTTYRPDNPRDPFPGAVRKVLSSDGSMTLYGHAIGRLDRSSADPAQWSFAAHGAGKHRRVETLSTVVSAPGGVIGRTLRSVSISDAQGRTLLQSTHVCDGQPANAANRISWSANIYDSKGRVIQTLSSSGATSDKTYYPCGIVKQTTAPDGSVENTRINHLGQTIGRDGPIYSTEYTLDPLGRVLSSIRHAGDISLTNSSTYDLSGRTLTSTDEQGVVTTYTYDDANRMTQVVRGERTEVTVSQRDGSTLYTEINGIRQQTYTYGVEADGRQWTCAYSGPLGESSPVWQKQWTDSLGRTVRREAPGVGGTTLVSESFYDAQGRLIRSTQTGSPDTLYTYDTLGELVSTALDINGNGNIDTAGPDRIQTSSRAWVLDAGVWWQESISSIHASEGNATPTQVARQRSRATGLGSVSAHGILSSETRSYDILGNETISQTWTDRAAKKITSLADRPTSTQDAIQVSVNGLTQTQTSATGVTTTFFYDALGRKIEARTSSDNGARSLASLTHYNSLGQVDWTEDAAGNRTTYGYDSVGRAILVTDALGQATHTAYDAFDRVVATWGTSYPVAFEYDAFGRKIAMATTRDTSLVSSNLLTQLPAGATLSIATGTALDVTRWNYDAVTGLLLNKVYADGQGPSYTYTVDGKLLKRTWARGAVTDYSYTTAGELALVDYADAATPDITYTYDRLGRIVQVSDGSGTRGISYDPTTLVQAAETLAMTGAPAPMTLTRNRDTLGRYTGYALTRSGETLTSATYGYDSVGHLVTADNVTFSYEPQSDRVATLTHALADGRTLVSHTAVETNRSLIDYVSHTVKVPGQPDVLISKYDYANNAIGQRTGVNRTGTAIGTEQVVSYGYDTLGQVTCAQSTVLTETSAYAYDPIGNRLTSSEGTAPTKTYAANNLNQYTAIEEQQQPFVPAYDLDGNMLDLKNQTGEWDMTWNGENRLVEMTKADQRLVFAYDYMGRRWKKEVYSGTGSNWTLQSSLRYLYDGYVQIAELDALAAYVPTRSYRWDPTVGDATRVLSMTLHGVGVQTLAFTHDSNKNTDSLIAADGSLVGHYAYGPFGQMIASTGSLASVNPFRFSSEFEDSECGLVYYNYRHYNSLIGVWLGRDQLDEQGGVNLYGFVNNEGINRWDNLGLVFGIRANDAYEEWGDIGAEGWNDGGVCGYGTFAFSSGMMACLDFFRSRDVENLSEAAGKDWDSDIGACKWLARFKAMQSGTVILEQATGWIGLSRFEKMWSPYLNTKMITGSGKRWGSISKLYTEMRNNFAQLNGLPVGKKAAAMDHWFFEQNQGLGRFLPKGWLGNVIKNNPLNLVPTSARYNSVIKNKMNPLMRILDSAPDWARWATAHGAMIGSDVSLDEIIKKLEEQCECEKKKKAGL